MKNVKKILAVMIVIVMTFALATTAFAANITISGTGNQYKAFKLMSATSKLICTEEHEHDDATCYTYAYTLNSKYAAAVKSALGLAATADDTAVLNAFKAEDFDAQKFANDVYGDISSETAEYTTTDKTFANVDQGYYLIAETQTDGDADTYSLVMLDTAGQNNISITSKESIPTIVKAVKEGDTYGVAADADIGDDVEYMYTITLPTNYASYDAYKITTTDTLADGLTFNDDVAIYVRNGETDTQIGSDYFTVTPTTTGFKVVITDLKTAKTAADAAITTTKDSVIIVKYSSELNEDAEIGAEGNENTVVMNYPNNPYGEGEGTSVPSDTIVFTYQLTVNKVDNNNEALAGAGFTLYKWDPEAEGEDKYVVVETKTAGTATTFVFEGLDEGQYKLEESTTPLGYHPTSPVEFKIVSTINGKTLTDLTVVDLENTSITGEGLTFTATTEDGDVATTIVNTTEAELPSTGGIGTRLFYIAGGMIFAAAAVLLITKKRIGCEG